MENFKNFAQNDGDSGWSKADLTDVKNEYQKQYNILQLIAEKGGSAVPNAWAFIESVLDPLVCSGDGDYEKEPLEKPKVKRIIDIGCGIGSMLGFITTIYGRFFIPIEYIGYDYSNLMTSVAEELDWPGDESYFNPVFLHCDYSDINIEPEKLDIIIASNFCNCMPNGDRCFENVLSLGFNRIIFTDVKLTRKESYYVEKSISENIKTHNFYHNRKHIKEMIDKYNYKTVAIGLSDEYTQTGQEVNFYLTKKDVS